MMDVGTQFGRLTVTYIKKGSKKDRRTIGCICSCGKETLMRLSDLKSGRTQSCGCLRSELIKKSPYLLKATHGLCNHPLYSHWHNMKARCERVENDNYSYYGGRGIKVCERWQDITNFVSDMEASYIKGLSLDRIDVNGDYCLDNCRWITHKEQMRNMRRNTIIEYKGEFKPVAQILEEENIIDANVKDRIYNRKMSIEDAISRPKYVQTGPKISIGDRFGRLLVTNIRIGFIKNIECLCDCGSKKWLAKHPLTSERTKSCGCYKSDSIKKNPNFPSMKKYNIKMGIGMNDEVVVSYLGRFDAHVPRDWQKVLLESRFRDLADVEGLSLDMNKMSVSGQCVQGQIICPQQPSHMPLLPSEVKAKVFKEVEERGYEIRDLFYGRLELKGDLK